MAICIIHLLHKNKQKTCSIFKYCFKTWHWYDDIIYIQEMWDCKELLDHSYYITLWRILFVLFRKN